MLEGKPTYKCVSCVKALRSSRDDKTPVRSFWSASISELSKKIGSMERKIILAHVTLYAAWHCDRVRLAVTIRWIFFYRCTLKFSGHLKYVRKHYEIPTYLTYLITFTYSMEQSPSWEANWFCLSRNSPQFMEPEGSLPHSQVPATCPYPEPVRSSPYPHILIPEDPS